MRYELGACAADREKYGLPEWVLYDKDMLDDVSFDQLDAWDREMIEAYGFGINTLVAKEFIEATVRGINGMFWLTCKMRGVEVPGLDVFKLRTRVMMFRSPKAADVGPPDGHSSDTSPEEMTDTAASATE